MARTIGWVESEVKKPEKVKEPIPVEKTEEPEKKPVKKTVKK